MNPFFMRHADPLVLGDTRVPGGRGTFDPLIARSGPTQQVSRINRPQRRRRTPARRGDNFHLGTRLHLNQQGMLALAAVAVAAALIWHNHH